MLISQNQNLELKVTGILRTYIMWSRICATHTCPGGEPCSSSSTFQTGVNLRISSILKLCCVRLGSTFAWKSADGRHVGLL